MNFFSNFFKKQIQIEQNTNKLEIYLNSDFKNPVNVIINENTTCNDICIELMGGLNQNNANEQVKYFGLVLVVESMDGDKSLKIQRRLNHFEIPHKLIQNRDYNQKCLFLLKRFKQERITDVPKQIPQMDDHLIEFLESLQKGFYINYISTKSINQILLFHELYLILKGVLFYLRFYSIIVYFLINYHEIFHLQTLFQVFIDESINIINNETKVIFFDSDEGEYQFYIDNYERAGELGKMGEKGNFKDRYFELYKGHLIYFKKKNKGSKAPSLIPLEFAHIVKKINDQKQKLIQITTNNNRRVYILKAKNENDHNGWFIALNQQSLIITENQRIKDLEKQIITISSQKWSQIDTISQALNNKIVREAFVEYLKRENQNLLSEMITNYYNKQFNEFDQNIICFVKEQIQLENQSKIESQDLFYLRNMTQDQLTDKQRNYIFILVQNKIIMNLFNKCKETSEFYDKIQNKSLSKMKQKFQFKQPNLVPVMNIDLLNDSKLSKSKTIILKQKESGSNPQSLKKYQKLDTVI